MEVYCIYRHIRLDTNKVFYIGIGKKRRPFDKVGRNNFWKNIVKKTSYEIQILKEDLSLSEAKELEIILISYYGRADMKKGNLVNLTDGGEGVNGKITSEETKKKLSILKKGIKFSNEHKNNLSISRKKRITTQETKNKMKNSYIARMAKKVINTETRIIYSSIKEASKDFNMSADCLRERLRGRVKNNTKFIYL